MTKGHQCEDYSHRPVFNNIHMISYHSIEIRLHIATMYIAENF